VVSALALGAGGAQVGTAFLATNESGAPPAHRAALFTDRARYTVLSPAFSGRPGRTIRNELADALAAESLPPYPQQLWLTAPLRAAAAARGNPEVLSLWAGQGAPLLRPGHTAGGLLRFLVEDTDRVLAGLAAKSGSRTAAPG